MNAATQHERTQRALNILAKWRALFAGWQLGTRPSTDPECNAIREHREATLLHRAELTAMGLALLDKKIITVREWERYLERAANDLCDALAARFPGVTANEHGLHIDPLEAQVWMTDMHWLP
jgi:hypothetical protein